MDYTTLFALKCKYLLEFINRLRTGKIVTRDVKRNSEIAKS
jgi:hypothetical protein